jgi:hypothetical protein
VVATRRVNPERGALRWAMMVALCAACTDVPPPPRGADAIDEDHPGVWLEIERPDEGALLAEPRVELGGRSAGTQRLEVRVDDGPAMVVTPGADARWSLPLALDPGPHTLAVLAVGRDGASQEVVRQVARGWRVALETPAPRMATEVQVGAQALARLLPAAALQTPMVTVDWGALTEAALGQGPAHGAFDAWTQPLSMVRVEETAFAPLAATVAPFGFAPTRLLTELLDETADAPLLELGPLAAALVEGFWRSHPAQVDPDGLVLTLGDLLADLGPLFERMGPVGAHPGVFAWLDPQLLSPGFRVKLRLEPRGLSLPGLDAHGALRTHHVAEGAARVALPVLDDVVGVYARPRVQWALPLQRLAEPVEAGAVEPLPRGGSAVWSAPPWTAERVAAEAAYLQFAGRFAQTREVQWRVGALEAAVSASWADGLVSAQCSPALGETVVQTWFWDVVVDAVEARLPEDEAALVLPMVDFPLGPERWAEQLVAVLHTYADELALALSPADLGASAALWLEAGQVRFAEDFLVFQDRDMSGAPLRGARLDDPPLFAQSVDGPVALVFRGGTPPTVDWVPLGVGR